DILDLSKIEAGQMEVYLEDAEVAPLCTEVVSTIRPLAEKNENEIVVVLGEGLGSMRTDVTKVRQALFNMLSNATKFTKKGRITLEARREPGDEGDVVSISVRDSGIGMTREQISELFVPFKQADASTSRKYGGTGLGLAITARFCRMLGGEVRV